MKCPKCGFEQTQSDGCGKCGVIFRKIAPAPVAPAVPAAPPQPAGQTVPPPQKAFVVSPPAASGGSLAKTFFATGGLAVVVLLWKLILPIGGGGDPLDGSYRNERYAFAFRADPAWILLTGANYDAVIKQYAEKIPPQLRDFIGGAKGLEVGFFKLDDVFTPSVNVVVVEGDLEPLNQAAVKEASEALGAEYAKTLENYTQESATILDVDGIPSLEVVSRTRLHVKIADAEYEQKPSLPGFSAVGEMIKPAEYRDYDLRFVQTLIRGKGRSFILTETALDEQWPALESDFEAVRTSFRVRERPNRFGHAVQGGVQGALVGAGLYFFYLLLASLWTGRE